MSAYQTLSPDHQSIVLRLMAEMMDVDGHRAPSEEAALKAAHAAFARQAPELSPAAEPPLLCAINPSGDEPSQSLERLPARARMLAYAAAAWMALADGILSRTESKLLITLADHLSLDGKTARFLQSHAQWIRATTELNWLREVDLLFTEAAKRIALIESVRLAA